MFQSYVSDFFPLDFSAFAPSNMGAASNQISLGAAHVDFSTFIFTSVSNTGRGGLGVQSLTSLDSGLNQVLSYSGSLSTNSSDLYVPVLGYYDSTAPTSLIEIVSSQIMILPCSRSVSTSGSQFSCDGKIEAFTSAPTDTLSLKRYFYFAWISALSSNTSSPAAFTASASLSIHSSSTTVFQPMK